MIAAIVEVVREFLTFTGWWFGTFFIFPYIGNNHPNLLIFFRWVETTNQFMMYAVYCVLFPNLVIFSGIKFDFSFFFVANKRQNQVSAFPYFTIFVCSCCLNHNIVSTHLKRRQQQTTSTKSFPGSYYFWASGAPISSYIFNVYLHLSLACRYTSCLAMYVYIYIYIVTYEYVFY